MDKLVFIPPKKKTVEDRYADIDARSKDIEKNLVNLFNAWHEFRKEFNKVSKKRSIIKKDLDLVLYCILGATFCSILLVLLQLKDKV
tara:strand:+ start:153 stop:413 length:261 start_codon:yes stop_codon:yes gene_type:complete